MNDSQATDKRPVVLIALPSRKHFGANVLFIPALLYLRQQHPEARFLGLGSHATSMLFERWGLVEAVWRHDRQGEGAFTVFRRTLGLRPTLFVNSRVKSIRLHLWSLVLHARQVRCFAHGLGRWIGTEARPWDFSRYKAFTYLGMVGAGWHDPAGDLLANWSYVSQQVPPSGALLLIPSGSKPEKKWPLSRFLEIAQRWRQKHGGPVQVLAGPHDPEVLAWAASPEAQDIGVTVVTGGLPAEVAAIRAAALVVGNDCGPSHLAQMIDCPRVLLFRPTTKLGEWFRPGNRAEAVKQTCPLPEVPVDVVWAALQKVMEKKNDSPRVG